MKTLLQIKSSLNGSSGQSSQLSHLFSERWMGENPEGTVVTRDLAQTPVPHLDAERFAAFLTKHSERSEREQSIVAFSDKLIDELRTADVITIGLPMYNLGIPSTLKAYFDHIARAGVTFQYTTHGPQGLLANKPVYILAARGGVYSGTQADSQSGYMKTFLNFIGLTDVQFVYAEGLNMQEDIRSHALLEATKEIKKLAAA
ncbi:FMN-dependent NADH-azoreductase [Gilvimarinus sp. 1_MG-2023]|uniref:FMN-dependent NADH-azoreductase n=1 Tax=Gilvimarinus sp. 1_MG-2023 TaxID=3062638 RepID=UPI0026E3695F|nr:NAD(P)H-dependent oxidoreductase [Gilvimarinus sp. 1_MG-2023]MDO6745744.1 NAD(P)H-dependent oxidoreductase [Gilvimarinus sp. 1_MG-2023]